MRKATVAFAVVLAGLGILGLVKGDFTPVWQPVPKGLPAREVLAYLCSALSVAVGFGLFLRKPLAARVLLAWCLLWLLALRLPPMFAHFGVDTWWACAQSAVMVATAWVLWAWLAPEGKRAPMRVAHVLYGLGMIPFGLAHFLYMENTAPLVPGWLPWHVGFGYFTGATFVAAGVAMIIGVCGRLAAALSAVQIGLFTLLVWVPIMLAGHPKPFQTGEFIVSIALTAMGWVVAESYGARRQG